MINVKDVGKRFGPQLLFSRVTLQLNPGQRYGLVGANGSGKSTFLRMLTGDEPVDDGDITFGKHIRLGVLRQDQFAEDDQRIVDVAMRGDAEVYSALSELDKVSHSEDPDVDRIVELNELIARKDGYTLEPRAKEILVGVGIPSDKLEEPLGTLSGGYKLRVLLAQVLTGQPDALLLDEPTNHLDILSIRWLEGFLQSYPGCAVVISHDRRFLDSVTTRILDVDYETITDYPGNYTAFLKSKEERAVQKEAQIERAEKQIAEKKAFVERFKAKATKARQAQSRVKQIEKIEVETVARTSRRAPGFRFDQRRPTGKDVLKVKGVEKSFGDDKVLDGVSFGVRRGERIGIIGANGVGKSTLLKILTEHLEPDSGEFEWGVHARVGYFAQDHRELLNDAKLTPLDFVWNAVPEQPTSYVRGQLGRMLFSGDEVEKKVTSLSGGEAARVIFARLAVEEPNVLILDEPTNHLDIEAIEALAAALKRFEGTLLFVSHDRWFVSQLATRIIELQPRGMQDFKGTYDEYLDRDGEDHLDAQAVSLKAKTQSKKTKDEAGPELSREEKRRRANRLKMLPKKRDELLARIEKLETEKAGIEQRYAEPDFFTKAPEKDRLSVQHQENQVKEELERALREWETVEQELESLSS